MKRKSVLVLLAIGINVAVYERPPLLRSPQSQDTLKLGAAKKRWALIDRPVYSDRKQNQDRLTLHKFLMSGPPFIDGCALSGLRSQPLTPDPFGTPLLFRLRPIGLALRGGLRTTGRSPHICVMLSCPFIPS